MTSQLQKISGLALSSSARDNIEITAWGADKGTALQWIAEQKGFSMAEVMAIGDHYNDLPMLKKAGISVAMENAEKDVKTVCDWTTVSNQNHGVAQAIERMLNEEQ